MNTAASTGRRISGNCINGNKKRNMKANKQRQAAKTFAEYWKGRGSEKSDTQKFWLSLLQEVFGVEDKDYIEFEKKQFYNEKKI